MTCNITTTPQMPDALPVYRPREQRDSDSTSIRSAAPSYTSAAPSYHSSMPAPARPRASTRLPNPDYAPGFTPSLPRRGSTNSASQLSVHHYNIPSWSSVKGGHQSRHYHSVANRRATLASAESERAAIAAAMSAPRAMPPPDSKEDILEEDPYLVGGEAAARAKEERLQRVRRGEEVLRQEDKAWDFMIAQMADWDERERSWTNFRRELDRPGLLRRRLGVLGRANP
ncbi:MAG: hypothetical protein M4579_004111 [Chaenotheca gracillima]|nr:MAG: hypothetical protein M4579_004111 [Chaenotheca gracillima]